MKQRGSQIDWKTVIPRLVAYVAAGAIVIVVISYSALLCVSLFLERVVSPAIEPPEHHIIIDKVEPEVPGLKLEEGRGSVPSMMDLVIINYTDQEVSVIDPQRNNLIRARPEKEGGGGVLYHKDQDGNWVLVVERSSGLLSIQFDTYPFMGYGKRETSWVLEGKVGDTPFKIYGRTVCVKNCIKE